MAFALIGNFPADTTEQTVRDFLAEKGARPPETILVSSSDSSDRVLATCTYADDAYAQAVAQELQGQAWNGRLLNTSFVPTGQG